MGGIHLAIVGTTAIPVATAASAPTHTFQGTVSGYSAGGTTSATTPTSSTSNISKFPFATDSPVAVSQTLVSRKFAAASSSSETNGYVSGGAKPPGEGGTPAPTIGPLENTNRIDKFPFANNNNASTPGNLTMALSYVAGHSSSTEGFVSGGYGPPGIPTGSIPVATRVTSTVIQRFPFATDANASAYPGVMSQYRQKLAGHSSTTHAYNAGGADSGAVTRANIEKFPFASVSNSTSPGNLTEARFGCGGASSNTHGYTFGGYVPSPPPIPVNGPTRPKTTLDKFPFATDASASSVGGLSARAYNLSSGANSTGNGYAFGGQGFPATASTAINKFPFATDASATNVASLPVGYVYTNGIQD